MTLTEQYRKGELPRSKLYYVKNNNEIFYCHLDSDNDFIHYGRIIHPEVLDEVPSFNEWQQIYTEWKILTNKSSKEVEVEEENTKIKELLRECAELMGDGTIAMHIDVYKQRKKDVLKAISQVLKENE